MHVAFQAEQTNDNLATYTAAVARATATFERGSAGGAKTGVAHPHVSVRQPMSH